MGNDLSICAVNLEPPAEFFCPSITGLNTPDLSDELGKCFEWFASDKQVAAPMFLSREIRTSLRANQLANLNDDHRRILS